MKEKNYSINGKDSRRVQARNCAVKNFCESAKKLALVKAGKERENNLEAILIAYKKISEKKAHEDDMRLLFREFKSLLKRLRKNSSTLFYDRKMTFITESNFEKYFSEGAQSSRRGRAQLKKYLKSKTEDFDAKIKLFESFSNIMKKS